jgi:Na+-translocating ferredoxin:NAD+ oxidoreductase RnfE subunit
MTGARLLVGSVVIISSATHLANVGLAGYALDLVRCVRMLLNAFCNNIEVKHGVFTIPVDLDCPMLIRAMAELDSWLLSLPDGYGFPMGARKTALQSIKNTGTGTQSCGSMRIQLPVSMTSMDLKVFHSSG